MSVISRIFTECIHNYAQCFEGPSLSLSCTPSSYKCPDKLKLNLCLGREATGRHRHFQVPDHGRFSIDSIGFIVYIYSVCMQI